MKKDSQTYKPLICDKIILDFPQFQDWLNENAKFVIHDSGGESVYFAGQINFDLIYRNSIWILVIGYSSYNKTPYLNYEFYLPPAEAIERFRDYTFRKFLCFALDKVLQLYTDYVFEYFKNSCFK